jgi:K+-transporting ATPase KdpF subunit
VRILCRIPVGGTEMIENSIVGAVAVALIIYLFVALLRPDKF